jgi:hypothetical protein
MQTIKLGSSGADVTVWQNDLNGAGFPVTVSGTFDDATEAATKKWQGGHGLTADGIVGPASWGAMTGVAQAGKTDKYAQFGRDLFLKVWPQIQAEAAASPHPEIQALGAQPITPAELQIFGAMTALESNYGHSGYKNLKIPEGEPGHDSGTIWNFGAEQAGKPPCDPSKAFEASDSGAGGGYTMCYAKHATAEEGVLPFLRQLTIRRPTSWAIAKTGDIDAYSIQMHAWTPPLTQLGVGHGSSVQNLDPITQVPGYFEQPPMTAKGRAFGLEFRVNDIAFTLNEPIAAKRGGPMPPGGLETPPGQDGGGLVWTPDTPEGQVGLVALLGGLGLIGWRLYSGHWPWPGRFPF